MLDIPGTGLLFEPGEEKTVDTLTPALSAAIQSGHLELIAQEATAMIAVENDGDTEFDLPLFWSGADRMHIILNGLVLSFNVDYMVNAASNQLIWLDEDIPLVSGDVFQIIGGRS